MMWRPGGFLYTYGIVLPPSAELLGTGWGDVNQVAGTTLPLTSEVMLLNVLTDPMVRKYAKLFIIYSTYYARREILLKWKAEVPPTLTTWWNTLNNVLLLYKIMYINRNCPSKFVKIWST